MDERDLTAKEQELLEFFVAYFHQHETHDGMKAAAAAEMCCSRPYISKLLSNLRKKRAIGADVALALIIAG